ncbi:hypothetical protein [Bacillus sp. EB600]|uniref:hypothetical protein n=1 Tax=Bacillus sp. EB600 TaxID=2806345 RepID=UPI00210DC318|nr:hypothetical protein [Bacillus sp. EB600]MCQ6278772.1 hypothetical protein [Bacillus sp. EB600]
MQYSVVQMNEKPVVLAGTWLDQMKKVSPYWRVDGSWINDRKNIKEAMVGVNIAKKYDIKPGSDIELFDQNKRGMTISVRGVVTSGGKEDNQIFVSTDLAEKLSQKKSTDIILLSLLEKGSNLEKKAGTLQVSIH